MSPADFRDDAVAASAAAVGSRRPTEAGRSCCVPSGLDDRPVRRRLKVAVAVAAVGGVGGLAAGGGLAYALKLGAVPGTRPAFVALACCTGLGLFLMFVPTRVERWAVRRHLAGVAGDDGRDFVSVEPADTYSSLKLLADDLGLVAVHPQSRCVVIHGLGHTYVAYAADVVRLELHANGRAVVLTYDVGPARLDLVVVPRSIRTEFKRQVAGATPSLYARMADALSAATGDAGG